MDENIKNTLISKKSIMQIIIKKTVQKLGNNSVIINYHTKKN